MFDVSVNVNLSVNNNITIIPNTGRYTLLLPKAIPNVMYEIFVTNGIVQTDLKIVFS